MTLRFSRDLSQMRPVLKDPTASGPDPVYDVYKDLDNGWENKTIIYPGTYNGEFTKTFGHYHADGKSEVYYIESGDGLLIMQKDDEVLFIKTKSGDKVTISPQYAHAWINIGTIPLVSYDDHHDPKDDYKPIEAKHGLAYYIMDDNGQPQAVVNPNYQNPPAPKWLKA